MKMTVKDYMEDRLAGIGFEADEFERAVAFAIRGLNESEALDGLQTNDGDYVPLKDCWNTYAENYPNEWLKFLYGLVKSESLIWCLNELHSRK